MKETSPESIEGKAAVLLSEKITRDELLGKAGELVKLLHRRTTARRFKASEHDRARLAYARVAVAAITAYSGILKDDELECLKMRVDALETKKK